jgi:hypothetical protein
MKLEHAVNKKGDVVSVEFFDNDDQKKAKLWIKVEVPADELKAYQKQLGGVDAIDILFWGSPQGSARDHNNIDRHRQRAALSYLKKVIEAEIKALTP